MSAAGALGFLLARSGWNRVRQTLRRLRQPRYAIAIMAWGLWLAFLVGNNLRAGQRAMGPNGPIAQAEALSGAGMSGIGALLLVGVGALSVALAWATGSDKPLLVLTEAELNLLVPAPLTRRQLVAYRLLRSAAMQLLPMLVLGLLLGGGDPARRLLRGLGWWCAAFTLTLHLQAAGLTRAVLGRRGVPWLLRLVLGLAVGGAVLGALVLGVRSVPAPGLSGPELAAWARAVLATPPLALGLLPILAPVRLALAPDASAFAAALPAAALVVAAHLAWILSLDVPFEERALEHAGVLARRVSAVRSGMGVRLGGARRSFRLRPTGGPALALAWKNLIRARRFASIQAVTFTVMAVVAVIGMAVASLIAGRASPLPVIALTAYPLAVVFGPSVVRGDLRRGLGGLDVLRSLPLRGHQLLLGEAAFPLVQLTAGQWLLLALAALLPNPLLAGAPAHRAAVVASLALAGLAVTAVGLVVQNGLAALFPAVAQPALEPGYSAERAGLQVLSMLAGLTLLVLVFLPGLALGVGAYVLLGGSAGELTLPLATAVGSLPVFAATAAGLVLVGRAFERADDDG